MSSERSIDPDKLKMFSFLVFSKLEGAVTSGMIHLGDRLGLYRKLSEITSPVSVEQLAGSLPCTHGGFKSGFIIRRPLGSSRSNTPPGENDIR